MAHRSKTRGKKGRVLLWLAAVLAVAAAGLFAFSRMFFAFDGKLIREGSTRLDLRDRAVTVSDYEQLKQRLPGCEIRWNIPIGSQVFDSTAREIVLLDLEEKDIPLFAYFDGLEYIHADHLECYDALWELQEALPDCRIEWGIHMAGKNWSPTAETLDLTGTGISWEEMMTALARFSRLGLYPSLWET